MRFLYTAGDKNDLGSLERDFPEAGEVPCGLFRRGPQRDHLGRRAACGLAAPAVRADRCGGDVSRCLVIPGLWG